MQSVRGFNDFFLDSADRFNFVIEKSFLSARLSGFNELILPMLEYSSLFERNLGNDSDVISKEIYKFEDRGGDVLALRPEFTASVVRSLCENYELKSLKLPIKLFSYGPVFRYERPQSGRYRQFHQLNYEIFGCDSYLTDVFILKLGSDLLNSISIKVPSVDLNFVGGVESKKRYNDYLVEFFNNKIDKLSESSKVRLKNNKAFRILDSKEFCDRELFQEIKPISDFYSDDVKLNIDKTLNLLTKIGINYNLNKHLVRGLDYYTGLIFEFVSEDLNSKSQNAILAGGRYDNMVSQISNNQLNLPAIGFGAGVERIMKLCNIEKKDIYKIGLISVSEKDDHILFLIKDKLSGIDKFKDSSFEFIFSGNSVSKKMKKANEINCNDVVVFGEDDLKNGFVKIKGLNNSKFNDFKIELFS